ncbi:hypothetical protein K1719_031578 [Acacia pycnantha]|nr:hypothetical protein K1719_031578 [Acacia pycnantha]
MAHFAVTYYSPSDVRMLSRTQFVFRAVALCGASIALLCSRRFWVGNPGPFPATICSSSWIGICGPYTILCSSWPAVVAISSPFVAPILCSSWPGVSGPWSAFWVHTRRRISFIVLAGLMSAIACSAPPSNMRRRGGRWPGS